MNTTTQMPPHLAYFERLLQLDRLGAKSVVDRFLKERGGDVTSLYDEVLVPALIHTGNEWREDRISVAHEHYISEVTRDLILRHGPRLWAAPEAIRGMAVACCAPTERHVLGLMMAADILRGAGLDVHLLGEGAPSESVCEFVSQSRADLLAISISIPEHLDEAAQLIASCRAIRPSLVVIAGGRALAGLDDPGGRIHADLVACDLRALHRELPDLLRQRSNTSA